MVKNRPPKEAYVVFRGKNPGVYRTWNECEEQVRGFPDNKHRSFEIYKDGERAWAEWEMQRLKEAEALVAAKRPLQRLASNWQIRSDSVPITTNSNLKRQYHAIDLTGVKDENPSTLKKQHLDPPPAHEDLVLEVALPTVTLSQEQEAVARLALQGHNIFLTGSGGCGKTVTIKEIMARFAARGTAYQVVCPSGIAALPLDGRTIHSWMGWTNDSMRSTLRELKLAHYTLDQRRAFFDPKVLIIEEISMVENQFLERMNLVLQEIIGCDKPFGGKQLIILGDFHQLPPVLPFQFCLMCGNTTEELKAKIEWRCKLCLKIFHQGDKWAFNAPVWQRLKLRHIRLEKIHRQKSALFKDILDKIRYSRKLDDEEWRILEREKSLPPGICAVKLMPNNKVVDAINERELAAIKLPPMPWLAQDQYSRRYSAHPDDSHADPWLETLPLKRHRFPESLELKEGAKVVLLSNIDIKKGLVNGSQGVVIGFQKHNGQACAPSFNLVPGKAKKRGPGPATRYETFGAPVVTFANGWIIPVNAVESTSQYGTNERPYLATRVNIPLKLAWALTIHKSQGMTLDFIEVSSNDMFEKGQLYVALSRGTSIEGVTLTGRKREQLSSDGHVLNFYRDTEWETFLNTDTNGTRPDSNKVDALAGSENFGYPPEDDEVMFWDPVRPPVFKTAIRSWMINLDVKTPLIENLRLHSRSYGQDMLGEANSRESSEEPRDNQTSKYFS